MIVDGRKKRGALDLGAPLAQMVGFLVDGAPPITLANAAALRAALAAAGVVMIEADEKGGPGVRLAR